MALEVVEGAEAMVVAAMVAAAAVVVELEVQMALMITIVASQGFSSQGFSPENPWASVRQRSLEAQMLQLQIIHGLHTSFVVNSCLTKDVSTFLVK